MTLTYEDRALSLVMELLRDFKARGLKEPDRMEVVARWLNIKPSRVRHIKNNDVARIAAAEYQRMAEGFDLYLDAKADDLERQLIALRARRAAR